MHTNEKLKAVREEMIREGIDAVIIPTGDPHQNEYLPAYYKTRAWISGFTGSTGTAVITMGHAGIWTDARYFLQDEMHLAEGFVLQKLKVPGCLENCRRLDKHLDREVQWPVMAM